MKFLDHISKYALCFFEKTKNIINDLLNKKWIKSVLLFSMFPVLILYYETVFAINERRISVWGWIFIPLFSIGAGCLFALLCSLFKPKANRVLSIVLSTALAFVYGTQIVYYYVFCVYLVIASATAGGIGQAIDPSAILTTNTAIWRNLLPIVLLLSAPIAIAIITKRKLPCKKSGPRQRGIMAGAGILLILAAAILPNVIPATSSFFGSGFSLLNAMPAFGVLRAEVLDITYSLAGVDAGDSFIDEPGIGYIKGVSSSDADIDTERKPQVMDIDFIALAGSENNKKIKEMDSYFDQAEPSYTNQYTGFFEGYNLIQITAEGFSPYMIDENLTPALYKMYSEGFRFENFYNPLWNISTTDGEYQHITGLLPKYGAWSLVQAGKQKSYLPFTMPRQFIADGVAPVYAYHNHGGDFYSRSMTHPALGYDYKVVIDDSPDEVLWPQSDMYMTGVTGPEYISDKRFHAYYMTVSGHMKYSFDLNHMSAKNRDLVKDLNLSETVQAYYACNIELDRAIESLLAQLEEAGVADRTVISIVPDHYPYGLINRESDNPYEYFDEMAGHKIDTEFEIYKSVFLLYCPGMKTINGIESVQVDKISCPADILPTLNNLFGFKFDSRLLAGRDILSDSASLVIFENRNWITDKGTYIARTGTFTPFEGVQMEDNEDYVSKVNAEVRNRILMSIRILDSDYYKLIIDN